MCLLSYVRFDKSFVFTSNRDISKHRPAPENVLSHHVNGKEIFFPQDYKGGSWLAYDTDNILILLNGAKIKHTSKDNYARSRGLILIELISMADIHSYWKQVDLANIEPFTIVFLDKKNQLYELIWDSNKKIENQLSADQKHLWLSSTLYTQAEKTTTQNKFLSSNLNTEKNIIDFNTKHTYACIKRNSQFKLSNIQTTCKYQIIKSKYSINCTKHLA